jgi:hypothetical protein
MVFNNRIILITLFLLCTKFVYCQKITHLKLAWFTYNQNLKINNKNYIVNELHYRQFIKPWIVHQYLWRGHYHYITQNKIDISAGLCLFYSTQNNPEIRPRLAVPELRPHIELGYSNKIGKVNLEHRIRTEIRVFRNTNLSNTELEDGFNYRTTRFRYRIGINIPLYKKEKSEVNLKMSDEVMFQVKNNQTPFFFDQNRISISSHLKNKTSLSYELGIIHWFQIKNNGDYWSRYMIRFTIYHKLDFMAKN